MEANPHNRIVLLVEDSDDDAFFFERAFERAGTGARFIRVVDGARAIEYFEQASARAGLADTHIVFLDLKLPVLSGFEVLEWLRDRRVSLNVIVLSGSELELDITHAKVLGASDYLVKPISSEQITRLVAPIVSEA